MNWNSINSQNNYLGDKIRNGDEQSLAKFIELNKPWIMNKALVVLNNHSDAEDVAAEIFIRIWHSIDKWNPDLGCFSTWVSKVCSNAILDAVRIHDRINKRTERFAEHHDLINSYKYGRSVEDTIISAEILLKIEESLEYLTSKMRIIYILRRLEGYNTKDVMRILGITKSNVNITLCRAERKLAVMLKGVID